MHTRGSLEAELGGWKGKHWFDVGPTWKGFNEIRYLIIFGDSYSQTNCWPTQAEPNEERPLGVPFPGMTSTDGPPNWVGHIVQEHLPRLMVYNYAKNGHTVIGIKGQVTHFMKNNPPTAPWNAENSLFITWVGINDLAYTNDPTPSINTLFEQQQQLYGAGARNFLFIDVPPVDRSPAYRSVNAGKAIKFHGWNVALDRRIKQFAAENESGDGPITTIYYSSHKVFTELLDDPESYGLGKDQSKIAGTIWVDRLHPTSAVHAIVAAELDSLLTGIPPVESKVTEES